MDVKFLRFLLNSCECDYDSVSDSFNYEKFINILSNCFEENKKPRESFILKSPTKNILLSKQQEDNMHIEKSIIDLLKSKLSLQKSEKTQEIFKLVDQNRDNFLDKEEFIKMIKIIDNTIPFTEILSLFNAFDFNKDGRISLLEFLKSLGIEPENLEKNLGTKEEKVVFKPIAQNILRLFHENLQIFIFFSFLKDV